MAAAVGEEEVGAPAAPAQGVLAGPAATTMTVKRTAHHAHKDVAVDVIVEGDADTDDVECVLSWKGKWLRRVLW